MTKTLVISKAQIVELIDEIKANNAKLVGQSDSDLARYCIVTCGGDTGPGSFRRQMNELIGDVCSFLEQKTRLTGEDLRDELHRLLAASNEQYDREGESIPDQVLGQLLNSIVVAPFGRKAGFRREQD